MAYTHMCAPKSPRRFHHKAKNPKNKQQLASMFGALTTLTAIAPAVIKHNTAVLVLVVYFAISAACQPAMNNGSVDGNDQGADKKQKYASNTDDNGNQKNNSGKNAAKDNSKNQATQKNSQDNSQKHEQNDGDVEPPVVTDDAENLLFTFVDATGVMQAVGKVSEIPAAYKSRVLVVDLAKTPEQRQAHKYAFFVDLNNRQENGAYPVAVVSRYDASKVGAGQADALPTATADAVVVYSAEWCGYCKKAKAWLTKENVPFIERDVEKQAGAQAELNQKLSSVGARGGGIPVIDWAGTLVMGFDQAKLQKLLQEQQEQNAHNDDVQSAEQN